MLLEIISPDKNLFSGEADLIQVPGSKGSFEILKNHAPIKTCKLGCNMERLREESLHSPGSVYNKIKIVASDGKKTTFEIDGGVIEAKNNKIIVLAENVL